MSHYFFFFVCSSLFGFQGLYLSEEPCLFLGGGEGHGRQLVGFFSQLVVKIFCCISTLLILGNSLNLKIIHSPYDLSENQSVPKVESSKQGQCFLKIKIWNSQFKKLCVFGTEAKRIRLRISLPKPIQFSAFLSEFLKARAESFQSSPVPKLRVSGSVLPSAFNYTHHLHSEDCCLILVEITPGRKYAIVENTF